MDTCPNPIKVLSFAPSARDWLAKSRRPRILHVFDRACNLVNECREVLSVVAQQIGNGPFNLVIEADHLFSDHLNTQSPIFNCANQLNRGELSINTDSARIWSAHPDWETFSAAWLSSAGRGEAGIFWHHFFDTLISADAVRIQEAVEDSLLWVRLLAPMRWLGLSVYL